MNNLGSDVALECTVHKNGVVFARTFRSDGVVAERIIPFNEFSNLLRIDSQVIETPMLPYGAIYYKKKGTRELVVVEYPPTVIEQISYRGDPIKHIPVPRSAWFYLLSYTKDGKRLVKTRIAALDELGPISMNTNTYKWPFSNYSDTFHSGVCWGSSNAAKDVAQRSGLEHIGRMFSVYFMEDFNSDLGFSFNTVDKHENEFSEDSAYGNVFKWISGADTFNPNWLQPSPNKVSEIIDSLL